MSRVIGDSHGSCPKPVWLSLKSCRAAYRSPQQRVPTGSLANNIYRRLARYHSGGLEAINPRSRRPASNPRAVADEVIAAIVTTRERLVADGLDAGPLTLQEHLTQAGLAVPSTSTIRRILHHHGLITPQPRKRPRSSYRRFAAEQPNECWQSDFTHWSLADGTDAEILNWLDDHSRYLLHCTAYRRVSGADVVASFIDTVTGSHPDRQRRGIHLTIHPRPQRLRTPPGNPGHHPEKRPPRPPTNPRENRTLPPNPQTLAGCPPAPSHHHRTADPAQHLHRHLQPPPHPPRPPRTNHPPTGLHRQTQSPPDRQPSAQFRIRHDHVDQFGKLTVRHASRLHHLGIGRTHAHTPVLILATSKTVTVISKTGHHILSSHIIDPDKNYWRNQNKNPGRWPGNP